MSYLFDNVGAWSIGAYRQIWRSVSYVCLPVVVVGVLVLRNGSVVSAQAENSSTTIVATILPVRSILVDSSGNIAIVESNTDQNVPPTVYKNSFLSPSVPLTPPVAHEYQRIVQHVIVKHHYGVVYNVHVTASSARSHFAQLRHRAVRVLTRPTMAIARLYRSM